MEIKDDEDKYIEFTERQVDILITFMVEDTINYYYSSKRDKIDWILTQTRSLLKKFGFTGFTEKFIEKYHKFKDGRKYMDLIRKEIFKSGKRITWS